MASKSLQNKTVEEMKKTFVSPLLLQRKSETVEGPTRGACVRVRPIYAFSCHHLWKFSLFNISLEKEKHKFPSPVQDVDTICGKTLIHNITLNFFLVVVRPFQFSVRAMPSLSLVIWNIQFSHEKTIRIDNKARLLRRHQIGPSDAWTTLVWDKNHLVVGCGGLISPIYVQILMFPYIQMIHFGKIY